MKKLLRVGLLLAGFLWCGRQGRNQVLSEWTEKFPEQCNADAAIAYILWPVWWPASKLEYSGPIRTRGLSKQERWEAFQSEGYGILGFDYFERRHGWCLGDPDPTWRPSE